MSTSPSEPMPNKLDVLFEEWRNSWRQQKQPDRTPETFVQDGPVYPEHYYNPDRAPRILFVLKDPNGFIGPSTSQPADITAPLRESDTSGWTWVVRWAAATLGLPAENPREDIWPHVAMMNLKKADGHNTVPWEVVNRHAFADREYIREEFRLLDPQIVFLCGTGDVALWLFGLDKMPLNIAEKPNWFGSDGRTFIDIWHPQYRNQTKKGDAEMKLKGNRLKIWPGR